MTARETVAQAIAKYAPNQRVAEAMGLGALLEGGSLGSGGFGTGDAGQSHGPFQIYQVAHHDITPAQSEDPDYAVRYMLHSYEDAAAKVPDSLWKSNPELAAEHTAYLAERPAKDYLLTAGPATVDAKWKQVVGKIPQAQGQPVGTLPGPGASSPLLSGFSSGVGGLSGTMTAVVAIVLLIVIMRK